MRKARQRCPKCGGEAVPFVYGLPGWSDVQQAQRGEIVLGGCVIEQDPPRWHCGNEECEHEWGKAIL